MKTVALLVSNQIVSFLYTETVHEQQVLNKFA